MQIVLVFAGTLLACVLLSARAERTVLSTAGVFLLVGVAFGSTAFGPEAELAFVLPVAELALFSVLFTDGMRLGVRDLVSAWRLPGRLLLVGMPLTFVAIGVLAHYVAGVEWGPAFLLAAVLSPTDPVFAAAIVGREQIPARLRHLLNVESGVNDGLALPAVLVLLAVVGGGEAEYTTLAGELALGVAIGVVVPYAAIRLERLPFLASSAEYEPLFAFGIGALVFAAAEVTAANLFLAAFAAGVTVATASPETRAGFARFGELVTELLKLGALLLFGLLVSLTFLSEIPLTGYVFALTVLFIARPVAVAVGLYGSDLDARERLVAAWFGPKGFASVVYGILVLGEGVPAGDELFHLVGVCVALSILAHSSSDVAIAKWFSSSAATEDAAANPLVSPDPRG